MTDFEREILHRLLADWKQEMDTCIVCRHHECYGACAACLMTAGYRGALLGVFDVIDCAEKASR